MNIINEELEISKKYMLEEIEFKGNKLVRLTRDNVARVEAMIRNDSDYLKTTDIHAGPQKKYYGSSAYWMTQLKYELLGVEKSEYSYTTIIHEAVNAVDRENSTHLSSDGKGREEIPERILNIPKDKLLRCLRDPDYEDMYLIREISRITSADKRARKNVSFASKFCHYACFYVFEGSEYQDNYSIYDSILKAVLPLYLEYYSVDPRAYDLDDYVQYRKAIDVIRNTCDTSISRNGFDHLLWYFHKGRMDKMIKTEKRCMFKRVSIKIYYARAIPVEAAIWVQDNSLHYSIDSYYQRKLIDDEVVDITAEDFEKKFAKIGIDGWKKLYTPPEEYAVNDGESWIVTYETDDGKKIVINGENGYPDNWKSFIKLIRSVTGKFTM